MHEETKEATMTQYIAPGYTNEHNEQYWDAAITVLKEFMKTKHLEDFPTDYKYGNGGVISDWTFGKLGKPLEVTLSELLGFNKTDDHKLKRHVDLCLVGILTNEHVHVQGKYVALFSALTQGQPDRQPKIIVDCDVPVHISNLGVNVNPTCCGPDQFLTSIFQIPLQISKANGSSKRFTAIPVHNTNKFHYTVDTNISGDFL